MPVAAESLVKVSIPEGVDVTYSDRALTVKGSKGTLSRTFSHPRLEMFIRDGSIVTRCSLPRKKEKALLPKPVKKYTKK